MKKLAIALTLSAGVLSLTACSSDEENTETVVETEAGDITKEAFYNELKDNYGEAVLQQMVTVAVLEDKYDVSEEDLDTEIQKLKEQLGDQFEMALQQQGYEDVDAYRKVLKVSLLQQAAVSEDIEITEEELKTQYDRMKTEIQASHILVADVETAKEVQQKLEDGGDFAKLASEYSTDKASAAEGGKLGYFPAGKMVPEFTDAAYNLEVDEISEPVKTQHGFHIIKVTDKREAETEVGSFDEEKESIRRELTNKKIDPTQAQAKIGKLLEDAKIDVKIDQFEDIFQIEEPKAEEQPVEEEEKEEEK